jgi:hypothetical protein
MLGFVKDKDGTLRIVIVSPTMRFLQELDEERFGSNEEEPEPKEPFNFTPSPIW